MMPDAGPLPMHVVAFNGSPRLRGNTHRALEIVVEELLKEGISGEVIDICEKEILPCKACGSCMRNKDRKCVRTEDDINLYVQKMSEADAIIIGSPTYFGNMTAQMKAFIDRTGFVSRANGDLLKRKVGASVAVNRRSGALATFNSMNDFFLIGQMIVVGSSYWNVAMALQPGEINNDAEGVKTMQDLGRNMAWLLKKVSR
jgi:multimeric flavodoxin WrbA